MASLPFYDEYDLSTVDVLLISHFHLDHAASLPYVLQHTTFKGRVFTTHPTKAIYRWLLSDFVKVSGAADRGQGLYSDEDLFESFEKIEIVDYHSTIEVDGIKFTAYHAGHVLGAALFLIEIGGVRILFTGDYSREEDRHLNQAEVPADKADVLITESTYGTGSHRPRMEKEAKLTTLIHSTINKGGRCLLPVFALGRAQEILLILDEYWEAHPELQGVSIYYASNLARKCMAVYQTYINMMNDNIRKKFRDSRTNPFRFKHIKSIKTLERFEDIGPAVVVASPGMLQNGVSRQLLERWAPEAKNTLILTGYSVEGTMAKQMINEPMEIVPLNNPEGKIARRLSVEELSFAAHVDYQANADFIDLVDAKHIILVHGETNNMGRLKSALLSKYQVKKGTSDEVKIYNPRNCHEIQISFKSVKVVRALGRLADTAPKDHQIIAGVIVEKNFQYQLLSLGDLREYAGLTTSIITEKQTITVDAGYELVRYHLEQMFGAVEILAEEPETNTMEMLIMNAVRVLHEGSVTTIEWVADVMNDAIADSVLAILLSVDNSPASVKLTSLHCDDHAHGHSEKQTKNDLTEVHERIKKVCDFLYAQFGDTLRVEEKKATITIENKVATIDFTDLTVDCQFTPLKQRVIHVLELAVNTVAPLAQRSDKMEEL